MNYTLTLTADEVNTIAAALGKMPYEAVAGVMERLKAQVLAAHKALEEAEQAKRDAEKFVSHPPSDAVGPVDETAEAVLDERPRVEPSAHVVPEAA